MKRRNFLAGICAAPLAVVAARVLPAEPELLGVDMASAESMSGLVIMSRAAEAQRTLQRYATWYAFYPIDWRELPDFEPRA
jgi:hypothetical protein